MVYIEKKFGNRYEIHGEKHPDTNRTEIKHHFFQKRNFKNFFVFDYMRVGRYDFDIYVHRKRGIKTPMIDKFIDEYHNKYLGEKVY